MKQKIIQIFQICKKYSEFRKLRKHNRMQIKELNSRIVTQTNILANIERISFNDFNLLKSQITGLENEIKFLFEMNTELTKNVERMLRIVESMRDSLDSIKKDS